MRFNPGPGWGGHCIPLDPFYLTWKAREHGVTSNFIEHAGEVNVKRPDYVIEKLSLALNDRKKSINGSRVLVLGIAYKKDIDDDRESPAYHVIDLLEKRGAKVDYHDPLVPIIRPSREHSHLAGRKSVALTAGNLAKYDGIMIVTDHEAVDYALVGKHAKLVVDSRNVMSKIGKCRAKVVKA